MSTAASALPAGPDEAIARGPHAVRIEPSRGWQALQIGELWEYRELIAFLVWRDVKVRYSQTALGVAWAVIQPLSSVVIFSVIFGRLAKLPSEGVPYPVFAMVALLPWQLFSSALLLASNSVVGSGSLLTKVYFPRLVVPVAAVMVTLVDFAVSCLMLAVLMLWFGVAPGRAIVALPLFVLLALLAALAVGICGAVLSVQYRDVRFVMPLVVQAWLFGSPVAYSATLIPEGPWRTLYSLNPMVGVIQGFRWALAGAPAPDRSIVLSIAATVALLAFGLYYFKRMEDTFADII